MMPRALRRSKSSWFASGEPAPKETIAELILDHIAQAVRARQGETLLTAADLAPYLGPNGLPVCPAAGVYTLNPVAVPPFCNIPGHTIGR